MARARNIKPGFFKNEELAELGPLAMLLFEGLWCLADKAGRLEDRPKRIKAETFPYFEVDVDDLLNGLARRGFIVRYMIEERRYIQVVNWHHQRPHSNETASVIPPCDDGLPMNETARATKGESTANQGEQDFGLIPDTLNTDCLIPDTGLLESAQARGAGADAPPKPNKKVVRATQVPEGWLPDPAYVDWAVAAGFTKAELEGETAKFVRHHRSKGNTFKDIGLAWQNWMERSRQYGARASPNGVKPEERRPKIPRFDTIAHRYGKESS